MQNRNGFIGEAFTKFLVGAFLCMATLTEAWAYPTPSMQFGNAPLVTPSAADAYYAGQSSPTGMWTPPSGAASELKDLARALDNDPDKIYEFVRNHVEFTPLFGLSKGALGAAVDRSGTAFDQAQLMVELLQEAGYSAQYRYGGVTLSASEFESWFGLTSAKGACLFLANGGFPAEVNSASSCSGLSGSVSSVVLRHVWVRAQIGGNWYEFDPAFKEHVVHAGINLKTAMGYSSASGIVGDATSGSSTTTLSGAPAIRNINSGNLNSTLDGFASDIIDYIKANYADASLEEIVGGLDLKPQAIPSGGLRQSSLSGHTVEATWSAIPDPYRTVLTLESSKFFADDVYGRRMTLEPSGSTGNWSLKLRVDGDDLATVATSSSYINNFDGVSIFLSVNHPYAANGGAYMDQDHTRDIAGLSQAGTVVWGFGDVSSRLSTKLSGERIADNETSLGNNGQCTDPPTIPPSVTLSIVKRDDMMKTQVGYSWAAQFSKAVQLQARVGGARAQHHHSFGIVASAITWDDLCGSQPNTIQMIQDSSLAIDISSGVSVVDEGGDDTNSKAAARAIALAGATLEGSVFEQILDSPETSSTVTRFNWANDNLSGSTYFTLHDASVWSTSPQTNISGYGWADDYISSGYAVLGVYGANYLGPGPEMGPRTVDNGGNYASLERGWAFVAFKPDASRVAHIITANDSYSKGGGGTDALKAAEERGFDAGSVADILRDTYEDRSSLHGVDLNSGDISYQAPPDVSTGNGGFPYELSFQRTFRAGGEKSRGLGAGWTHNLDVGASVSGSGLEAMGETAALNAAASIVAMVAMQDLYDATPAIDQTTLKRFVTAQFVAHWWREYLQNNVVSINIGASRQQFFRLPTGVFNAPPGQYATLAQSGSRTLGYAGKFDGGCQCSYTEPYPWRKRAWVYNTVGFTLTTATGEEIEFDFGRGPETFSSYDYAEKYINNRRFVATEWRFPSGYQIAFNYDASNDYRLLSVSNTDGRTVTLNWTQNNLDGVELDDDTISSVKVGAGGDLRQASFTYATSTQAMMDGTASLNLSPQAPKSERPNRRRLTAVQNPQGQTTTYDYVSSFLNTGSVMSGARRQWFPKLFEVIAPLDPNNAVMRVTYDRLWRVADFKDAEAVLGNRGAFEFRVAPGALGEREDPGGGIFRAVHDMKGRPVAFTDEIGETVETEYDGLGRVTKRIYPEGNEASFGYDARNNVTGLTRTPKPSSGASALSASAVYHATWNKPTSVTDFAGHATDVTYFSGGAGKGQAQYVDLPAASSGGTRPRWTYAYSTGGRLSSVTSPEGDKRDFAYSSGDIASVTIDPVGLAITTSYTWNTIGDLTAYNGPRTDVADTGSITVDNLGRPLVETDALSYKTEHIYDANGRETKTCVQVGTGTAPSCSGATYSNQVYWAVTETTYSATGKPLTVKDPDGHVSYTYYDSLDRPLVTVDAAGRKSRFVYDALGRVVKEIRAWTGNTDGTGATVDCATMRSNYDPSTGYLQQCYKQYAYTDNGQIETVTDAGGNVTTYEYDGHDRLYRTYFPSKTTPGQSSTTDYEEYAYDANGNMTSKRARSGQTIAYYYDDLNRLMDRLVPGAPTHSANSRTVSHDFTYDLDGRRVTATHDGVTLGYAYDDAGRMTSQTHNSAMAVAYAYDKASNVTSLTYPDGWAADFEYDVLNRVTDAIDDNGTSARTLASVSYDRLSRRQSIVYDNGTSASYAYTARGDLTDHDWDFAGTSDDAAYDFTYNGVGQLLTETVSNAALVWSPSANAVDAYVANGLNQYASITPSGGSPVSLVYDGNGNLTADVEGRGFSYDAENVLRHVEDSGAATIADYAYYADGARRTKTVGATVTAFYYAGDQEIAEYDGSTLLRRYVRLPGSVDEPFLMIDYTVSGACNDNDYGDCEAWAHQNRLGTVVAITDDAGAVIETYAYTPYGAPAASASGFPFRFTGQKLDPETGLYYYKARYYDPETGRFLQTDPIGYEDQMNLYAYVANDPVNFFDPSGLKACPADDPNCIDDPDSETEGEEQEVTDEQREVDEIVVTAKRKKKLGDTPIDFELEFPDEQYFRVNPDGSVEAVDGKETAEFSCPSGDKSSTVLNRGDFAGARAGGHTHPNWAAGGPGPDDGVLPGALGVTGYVVTPTGVIAVERTSVGYRARLVDGRWGTSKRNVQRRVRDWNQNAGRSGEKCVRK